MRNKKIKTSDIVILNKNNVKIIKKDIKAKDTISKKKIKEVNFLKEKGIISDKFINLNKVVFIDNYQTKELNFNLLKILYDSTLGEKISQDPYVVFIYVKNGNKLIKTKILYSIDIDDIEYSFKLNNNLFIRQYDSTTGWHKYFTFLETELIFIETKKLDEIETIIKKTINIEKLTYKTKINNKIRKFNFIKN